MEKSNNIFDIEDETTSYIYSHLSDKDKKRLTENDIDYVMDIVCDYYNKIGLLEDESNNNVDISEEEMYNFILKEIKKDDVAIYITEDDVQTILDLEFEYGKSIGIYKEA